MNVLVIGSGGREHALVWKLSQSKEIKNIYCAPGNGGISEIAQCAENINVTNIKGLLELSKMKHVDLVVVGPENPLAQGIVDTFRERGIPIFGPERRGALIEASKAFSKELMQNYNVPTAPFRIFSDHKKALTYIDSIKTPYVIKADGLCAGKGAYVIKNNNEGKNVLHLLMNDAIYGAAGKKVVVEEFLPGIEASYLAFTDGQTILPMPIAQDHKALLDNDEGPNTGGMGAYAPVPFISSAMESEIKQNIMLKTIKAMKSEGIEYKGVLYGGLMLSGEHSYVIEFNARMGDPETQPILYMMKSDILPVIMACIENRLDSLGDIEWVEGVAVCVVIAAGGYPDNPDKGKIIKGLKKLKGRNNVMVFHSGTKKIDGHYVTSGGRVLGITAHGKDYSDAIAKAYEAISEIHFEGMQFRKDIGKKAFTAPKV